MSDVTPVYDREADDGLWVPILTHYGDMRPGAVDIERTIAHLGAIRPSVRQIMLAGSTGDGWDIDAAGFDALIDLAARKEVLDLDLAILFGALCPTTEEVVARLRRLEERLRVEPALAEQCRGVVVCPPVDPAATQEAIKAHYDAVMAQSTLPIAVYQLPQVTGCTLAPQTLADLSRSPRVTMFKDSSGADAVADSRLDFGTVWMVRGAEGGYDEALKPVGPYDGWLLSTGNAVAPHLREILHLRETGDAAGARELSGRLSTAIAAAFEAAQGEPGANAFSNANRAMDHIQAHGSAWRDQPLPRKVDGNVLSLAVVEKVERVMAPFLDGSASGYMKAGAVSVSRKPERNL
ncbi:dihydrodipicolinate synthase family protein [Jiella pelagia]|uniref:Dihydrodipicolinate synthase family protein n=1 Tax=Jiella pelagia TaxID=2986949 RepID=A0ABY7C149_9HYPH|nr:dihydrodipicolinate synthase family protein [Jiella pelagia]WAP69817.1 dihydrodipicolinate synthase family protein [Jiella pelagia]